MGLILLCIAGFVERFCDGICFCFVAGLGHCHSNGTASGATGLFFLGPGNVAGAVVSTRDVLCGVAAHGIVLDK